MRLKQDGGRGEAVHAGRGPAGKRDHPFSRAGRQDQPVGLDPLRAALPHGMDDEASFDQPDATAEGELCARLLQSVSKLVACHNFRLVAGTPNRGCPVDLPAGRLGLVDDDAVSAGGGRSSGSR